MEQENSVVFPELTYPERILWNEGRIRTFYEFDPDAGLRNPRGSIPLLVRCTQGAWE